jgi:hypothetical protein
LSNIKKVNLLWFLLSHKKILKEQYCLF